MNNSLTQRFDLLRDGFRRDPFPSCKVRRKNLLSLEQMVHRNQDELAAAIDADFGGRDRHEILFSELYVSLNAVRHARKHAAGWMAPRPRALDWPLWPGRAWVQPQPLGVIGVIAPWNYPLFLAIPPVAAALAAGNRVMMKPSEHTPRTSALLERLIAETFPADLATVVSGDAETGREFTRLPFDHLLFTGSTAVGREVMRAASENLTPLTLELGGKSPAIVAESANLRLAAEDIAYGKFLNGGQTCIAPDYVLVHESKLDQFVLELRRAVTRYWPDFGFTSTINDRHRARLAAYLSEARERGVETFDLGRGAILIQPPDDLAVMREEIFGPLLPVKSFQALDEAIGFVNRRDRPLALYLFARDRKTIDRITSETVSGGLCINDTLLHIAVEDLPFGGVGASGIGHYHGREGFDSFSKLKPVFKRYGMGLGRTLRPPYGRMQDLLRKVLIG